MKRLRRRICASTNPLANECIMTPTDIIDFLSQIPELHGCSISLEDSPTGSLLFVVGENVFELADSAQTVL